MTKYRILLGGESTSWCQSVAQLFQQTHNFEVVDQVRPEELLEKASIKQPDVILLKLDESNLSYLEELKSLCPFTLVTVVMENPNRHNVLI